MRTIEQYNNTKKTKKSFNERWAALLDNIMMPIVQRAQARRTISQDLVEVQPINNPTGIIYYIDYQYSMTPNPLFPFWKIKVIFK